MITITPLRPERLAKVKVAYTPRNVRLSAMANLLSGDLIPQAGDLVLARVDKLGQHSGLELSNGRRATLFVGDEIIVCYGNRYAPDQFEAEIPLDLGQCHLVAAGGIASRALSSHANMKSPTVITPIGLLGDVQGRRLNLAQAGLEKITQVRPHPYTIAVVGTAMNAGKTTTVANLIYGLTQSGLRVGAAKVTGTGSGKDSWLMQDAGAAQVYDFTHAGYPSTYRVSADEVNKIMLTLTGHLSKAGVDVIVFEVADGLYQTETAALLSSAVFTKVVDGVFFAAGDAMGAVSGTEWLQRQGLPILGISGVLTASPLAMLEAAKITGMPVYDKKMLRDPGIAADVGLQVKQAATG